MSFKRINGANIAFNDQNEPLPIDMNRIVFSTEGHIFLWWSKLRPSRIPKYEKVVQRIIKMLRYQIVHRKMIIIWTMNRCG